MANEKLVNRENLKAFRQANDTRYKNGTVVVGKSLATKSIENISEESGNTQETPFILQGTGTANGTNIVDTSPVGKQLEKQGNSVVVNNQVQNGDFSNGTTNWTFENLTTLISSGVLSATTTLSAFRISQAGNLIQNHKYLILYSFELVSISGQNSARALYIADSNDYLESSAVLVKTLGNTLGKYNCVGITTASNGGGSSTLRYVRGLNFEIGDTFKVDNIVFVDLTQWFNGDIPQDILDNPENAGKYGITSDLPYNTGTLTNCNGQYLVCGGRNVWDEEWKMGSIDSANGQERETPSSYRLISKNYIRVIPNQTYYFYGGANGGATIYGYDANHNYIGYFFDRSINTTFTTPSNCYYIRFQMYSEYGNSSSSTYQNNITISLYYTPQQGGEGYDQYYAYETPKVYDTGTETLRSAGSVKDIKKPDGTIYRVVGTKTLSSNDVSAIGTTYTNIVYYQIDKPSDYSGVGNYSVTLGKISMADFINSANDVSPDSTDYIGKIITASQTVLYLGFPIGTTLEQAKAKLDGKTIYYELATPTTEQGTPFAENIEINDYGTMSWLDTNNDYVSIPQGCKIFYPADYVLFLDSLNSYASGSATNIALKSDLSESETERDSVDTQLKNAIGGTLRQMLAISQSIDFNNTDFVDLGTLTWVYNSTDNIFYTDSLSSIIAQGSAGVPFNMISSLYKTISNADLFATPSVNLVIAVNNYNRINVRNTSYTDATIFKNAMKGVLLAYEKAS